MDIHFLQAIHENKISTVSFTKQSHIKSVMFIRVNRGTTYYFKHIISFFNKFPNQLVNMSFLKSIRMQIITAKHNHSRIIFIQILKGIKIPCSTAFSYKDFHTKGNLFFSFYNIAAFMVRCYTCCHIFFKSLSR